MVPVKYTVLYMDTSLLVFHERKKVKEINLKKIIIFIPFILYL